MSAKPAVTYFIQGEVTKNIKIGKTTCLLARMKNLQSTSPDKLVCLLTVDGDHEAEYHDRFQHLRLHGEWFEPAQELLDFIAMLPQMRAEAKRLVAERAAAVAERALAKVQAVREKQAAQEAQDRATKKRAARAFRREKSLLVRAGIDPRGSVLLNKLLSQYGAGIEYHA